jgi:hypothetical protein
MARSAVHFKKPTEQATELHVYCDCEVCSLSCLSIVWYYYYHYCLLVILWPMCDNECLLALRGGGVVGGTAESTEYSICSATMSSRSL